MHNWHKYKYYIPTASKTNEYIFHTIKKKVQLGRETQFGLHTSLSIESMQV